MSNEALIAEAREFATWIEPSQGATGDLLLRLADALEAAERKPVIDREALAERMFYINGNDDWSAASESERQDWRDQAHKVIGVVEAEDKREVQAEALEAAADGTRRMFANKPGVVSHWLRTRAAQIREGRA